jgi:hypothetical protein
VSSHSASVRRAPIQCPSGSVRTGARPRTWRSWPRTLRNAPIWGIAMEFGARHERSSPFVTIRSDFHYEPSDVRPLEDDLEAERNRVLIDARDLAGSATSAAGRADGSAESLRLTVEGHPRSVTALRQGITSPRGSARMACLSRSWHATLRLMFRRSFDWTIWSHSWPRWTRSVMTTLQHGSQPREQPVDQPARHIQNDDPEHTRNNRCLGVAPR